MKTLSITFPLSSSISITTSPTLSPTQGENSADMFISVSTSVSKLISYVQLGCITVVPSYSISLVVISLTKYVTVIGE